MYQSDANITGVIASLKADKVTVIVTMPKPTAK
jgi:hypothetical protein